MAESLASIIDLIHPTASGIGVITTDQVFVVFDRAIDENTVTAGNFFVTGPDFDTWIGPDLQLFQEAEGSGSGSGDILESPGFDGIVQGTISFERLDLNSLTVISGIDTVGSGLLYRTKAIFTPTNRLAADTEYTVYLSGDEDDTDTLQTGISERTVFDTLASGINTGSGSATFEGGYIGLTAQDVYHAEITTSGEVGVAKFTFWTDNDPLSVFGPFKTKQSGVLLSNGVSVDFTEGLYRVGDHFQAVVKARNTFTGNLLWPFKTGSGSLQVIPDSVSTSVIGDPLPTGTTTSTSASSFSLVSSDPADAASNVTIPDGEFDITLTFNDNIELTTAASGVWGQVFAESVTGDTDTPASGILIADTSVSGKVLTVTVASGQLNKNNLVTVTIEDTLQSTSGTSLGADETVVFSTQYSPLYCTERRVRLDIGAFIGTVAPDTVNLAIHVASLMADQLVWNISNQNTNYLNFAKMQWTCCKAEEILLLNTTGGSGALKSKRLGDLSVEYDTSNANVSLPLQRAMECQLRWETVLQTGGNSVQTPSMVVKGTLDPDRPPIGRGWAHTRSEFPQIPAANRKFRFTGSRRTRNIWSVRKGWWNKS